MSVQAQPNPGSATPADVSVHNGNPHLTYIVPLGTQRSVLYHGGAELEVATEERWRFMCGSDPAGCTLDDLIRIAENTHVAFEEGPAVIVDSGLRGAGLNLIYNCDASVPAEALSAFAIAEEYLEGLFSDEITVSLNCRFDTLSASVLGSTASNFASHIPYAISRSGLQYGMDSDDVIQAWLPPNNSCPVRYDGSSSTVSHASIIDWTKANYKSTVGTLGGSDASMAYNDTVNWDYQPANGIGTVRISFVDVVCHETGHALGFVTGTESSDHMETLDLYRFCRQDGTGNYNPDTYEDLQTTPRIVCNNNPNDQQNTDLIDVTYRMEDGDPQQASHFRNANDYGCMCPLIANGVTRYPDYYTQADINCFDAIGYDYPPCEAPQFTSQPTPTQTVCRGHDVTLSISVNMTTVTYQWRNGGTTLVDDGMHIFGATTDTLSIIGMTDADVSSVYSCVARNTVDDCSSFSDYAEILVDDDTPVFTVHPTPQEVTAGDPVIMSVQLSSAYFVGYQWEKNGEPLVNNGRISGVNEPMMIIYPSQVSDSGEYTCVATSQLGMQCDETSNPATLIVHPDGQNCPNPGASGAYCTADIDGSGDCLVNLADLAQLLANYGITSGATHEQGDIEPIGGDGDVDLADLAALLAQYGNDCN